VWYFRTVLTVWYFRTVLTVWYFSFSLDRRNRFKCCFFLNMINNVIKRGNPNIRRVFISTYRCSK